MSLTYSTTEAVEQMGAPSERWLIEQLRAGRFRGRKVGRMWRMTEQDIHDALDICSNDSHAAPKNTGLTPRSRRRMAAQ